jgi:hypothetical protein
MTPERWRRVKEVFAAAVEAEAARRAGVLDELCAGDASLRAEVWSLVAAHESHASMTGDWLALGGGARPEVEFTGDARFAVEARLGAGGFGVVYRARDAEAGRAVALKVLRDGDAAGLVRFKREFRALADLVHPNLVRLRELFVSPERVFFTMDLAPGRPLVEALGARPADTAVARAFLQLAEGVAALHREGLRHRDLKPSNVLFDAGTGSVVVLDFGLATDARAPELLASSSGRGPICGTPAYMAPEQFVGDAATEATDWYGVGTMLHEALAGRLPFAGPLLSLVEAKAAGAPAAGPEVAAAYPRLAPLAAALLAPSPAARPDGAAILAALAEAAGQASAARPRRPTPRGLFVGREAQLAALRAAWARARAGELAVVCVRGASGMGKTALVRRFLEELPDAAILSGRCHEREALGYKALDGVVDALGQLVKTLPRAEAAALLPAGADELARLFPALRASRDGARKSVETDAARAVRDVDPRRRAFDALRELLGAVARRWPCVVFIDDLQWGDEDSAALLRHLLRPPSPPPLLVIAACRRKENAGGMAPAFDALLEALRASGRVEELLVDALAADETRALAARLLGADDAAAAAVADEAGGVPFFVDTLVERMHEGAPAARAAVGLEGVLRERVEALPPGAQRLLEVVALAGKPLDRRVARAASGLAADDDVEPLLRARHFLRLGTDGASLETYHDRIRETVAGGLPPEARPRLHLGLARALVDGGGADPEDLAVHFAAAGEGATAAGHAIEAASRRAEALAFDRAAALYELALELRGPGDADAPTLTEKMADALAAAGRGDEAGAAYLDAAARRQGDARDRTDDLVFKGATQYVRAGHIERGRTLMATALRGFGWRVPRTTLGALLAVVARRAQLALRGLRFRRPWTPRAETPRNLRRLDAAWTLASSALMVDMVRASYFQAHNLLTALDEGEPLSLARALGLEAIQASLPGARSPARADRIVRLLHEVLEGEPDPIMDALAPLAEGVVAANRGEWRRARDRSLAATESLAAHGAGVAWELATSRFFLLGALVSLGEFREFGERFPGYLEDARARGDLYAEAVLVLSSGSYIVPLKDDRIDDANRAVDDALARLPPHGYRVVKAWAHFAKVDVALYAGDAEAAWRLEREAWPGISRSILVLFQTLRIYLRHQHGRAAVALAARRPAERDRLLATAAADARSLERERLPWASGFAGTLRAGIAFLRGDATDAASLLAAAAERLEAAEMGMHAASARWVWGGLVGGEEGRAARARAEAWMRAQSVVRPDRVARTVVPGFERPSLGGSR